MNLYKEKLLGPALIGTAALVWATDALVRFPAGEKVDAAVLVYLEHILVLLVCLPFILKKFGKKLFSLSKAEFFCAALSGTGGSALATTFFTASMSYVNPSVAVLLQKLQPIMVVVIAYIFLGERPMKKFYLFCLVALAAGVLLSFPDLDFDFLSDVKLRSIGVRYALLAAFFWASSTVSGKILVRKTPPLLATFWRFVFGFFALTLILFFAPSFLQKTGTVRPDLLDTLPVLFHGWMPFFILYLSLVPGLAAFLLYYAGLARTSAGASAFIELIYPIGAVILNTAFLNTPLNLVQVIAALVLMVAVTAISLSPTPSESSS
ncbi:MAG: DMT family transporter [Bdellovibrio sp.]|nr:DMT family transporter [Bdellovibrio sp.]